MTAPAPERPPAERTSDSAEVVLCYGPDEARRAAERCLAANACTFCDVCELLCPDQCITRDPDSGEIRIDLTYCKGCGLCAHFCPKGSLRMELEQL